MIDSLLLIGDPTGMEDLVIQSLRTAASSRVCASIALALEKTEPADLVVILQHWSDEYGPAQVRELLEAFPLSRIVVIQGAWCASDRRTRQYWPASLCVPVPMAAQRIQQELDVLSGRLPPLPWTAGLDEIFAFDHGGEAKSISP